MRYLVHDTAVDVCQPADDRSAAFAAACKVAYKRNPMAHPTYVYCIDGLEQVGQITVMKTGVGYATQYEGRCE